MEGIFITVTHSGTPAVSLLIDDIVDATDGPAYRSSGKKAGPVYVPEGATVEIAYTSSVARSLESGTLRSFIDEGFLTAAINLGPTVSTTAAVAAGMGIRTHPAGTTAFFANAVSGDNDAAGTSGAPWKTIGRIHEAHRFARIVLGEEARLTVTLQEGTFTWDADEWHMAQNIEFIGDPTQDIEVLPSTATATSTLTTTFDGGLVISVAPGPGWTPNVTLRDGTFVQDSAGVEDARAVAEALTAESFLYAGENTGTVTTIVSAPTPIRLFRQGVTLNFDPFGSTNRLNLDNVKFQKLNIGSAAVGLRIAGADLNFTECAITADISNEDDLAVFNRCWMRPAAIFQMSGSVSYNAGVIDGGDPTFILSFARRANFQFANMCVLNDLETVRFQTEASLSFVRDAHLRVSRWPGLVEHITTSGIGAIANLDSVKIFGDMDVGVNNFVDGAGNLFGGWQTTNDVVKSDLVTPAEVVDMLRPPFIFAGAPGLTDDASAGWSVNNRWMDTAAGSEYVLTDSTVGAAVWKKTTP